jgi:hypothetical protein
MVEERLDCCGQRFDAADERAEDEAIAWSQARGLRTLLGPRVVIAGSKNHGREMVDVVRGERGACGQSDFDVGPASQVHAVQAGRQRGGIVRDREIARVQEIDKARSRRVRDAPVRVNDQEPSIRRPLDGSIGGNHARVSSTAAEGAA